MTKLLSLEQLLDVAEECFRRSGFANTSLQEIAAALSMTRSALYYHVGSKGELWMLVAERRALRHTERLAAIVACDVPPADRLAAVMRAYMEEIEAFSPRFSDWYIEEKLDDASRSVGRRVDAVTAGQRRLLRSVVIEGIEQGNFDPDCDPAIVVQAILGICFSLPRWFQQGGRLSIDAVGDSFIRLVLEGLLTGPRRTGAPGLVGRSDGTRAT
jgi:AcrR family transcriptional regulator